jgi:hypothetical protein
MWYLQNLFYICAKAGNSEGYVQETLLLLFRTTALTLFNIVSNSSYEFSYSFTVSSCILIHWI